MLIRHTAEVLRVHSKRGTENTHAALVLQLAIRLDRIRPEDRGHLMGFTGEEVEVTLRADNLLDPSEPRPMERLWQTDASGEHTRPGPTEACTECGRVIGEDPDAAFYTPIAGPPRPVCGACALAIEDQEIAEQAEAEERAADDEQPIAQTADEIDQDDEPQPIGDGPMPERPDDQEPVTTPIRRGRVRAESVS